MARLGSTLEGARLPQTRSIVGRQFFAAVLLTQAALGPAFGADDLPNRVSGGITLHLVPAPRPVPLQQRDAVPVEWQLENIGPNPITVCQFPGIAFFQRWECPGGWGQRSPGTSSSRSLARKYFITLAPGEAIIGHSAVPVWSTPTGKISVFAQFSCSSDGREQNLSAWRNYVFSNVVVIDVPTQSADASACPRSEAK